MFSFVLRGRLLVCVFACSCFFGVFCRLLASSLICLPVCLSVLSVLSVLFVCLFVCLFAYPLACFFTGRPWPDFTEMPRRIAPSHPTKAIRVGSWRRMGLSCLWTGVLWVRLRAFVFLFCFDGSGPSACFPFLFVCLFVCLVRKAVLIFSVFVVLFV